MKSILKCMSSAQELVEVASYLFQPRLRKCAYSRMFMKYFLGFFLLSRTHRLRLMNLGTCTKRPIVVTSAKMLYVSVLLKEFKNLVVAGSDCEPEPEKVRLADRRKMDHSNNKEETPSVIVNEDNVPMASVNVDDNEVPAASVMKDAC